MTRRLDPQATFDCMGILQDGYGYRDIEFTDNSPKSLRRIWTLTIPYPDENHDAAPYSTLRRSETDESELDYEVELPAAMTAILLASAGDLVNIDKP